MEPTHILMVAVPLNLDESPPAENWDIQGALSEALVVIMALLRLGTLGVVCNDPNVTLESLAEKDDEALREAAQAVVDGFYGPRPVTHTHNLNAVKRLGDVLDSSRAGGTEG